MKRSFVPLLSLFLGLSLSHSASAGTLLSDNFNYPDGPIVGAPNSPWMPNTGTANTALVTNNALIWSTSRSEDIVAPLSATVATNDASPFVYASFTIKFIGNAGAAGTYLAHFTGTPLSAHRGRVWVSTNGTSAFGKVRIGIVNSSLGNETTAPYPNELSTGVTYTVVTRLDVSAGIASMWIDPTLETDPSVTANDTPGITNILNFGFRQATGIGTSIIDRLRVGTTFADVAGTNDAPSISPIPAQSTATSTATPAIPFTVSDTESPAGDLIPSAASSNPTLVPVANIVFGGSGANRTVTVTPAAGQQGTATITVRISDPQMATNSTTFLLSVGLPSISSVPTQIIATNASTGAIPVVVGDDSTPAGDLVLSGTSANPALIPDANLVFGGSGANRTVTITPAPDAAGFSIITLVVTDGPVSASNSFMVIVYPNIGVVKFDDFNRPNGSLVVGDGNWITHSGTFGEAQITNNALRLTSALTEDVSTLLTNGPYAPSSGAIFYASFKVNFTQLPSGAGEYFAHFKDDGAQNFRGRVYVRTNDAAPGHYRLGIANAGTSPSAVFPVDLATNVNHTVVVRYVGPTGISTLWVNPASEASTSVTATDTPQTLTVHTYAFRENNGMGTLLVDDLTVGGRFADVLSLAPALTISAVGNNVTISWPASATDYVLRYTDAFPANWQDFSDQGTVQGAQKVVTLNGVTGNRFFELRKP